MPDKHIIRKIPEVFIRHFQSTIRSNLYRLIATSPALDHIRHSACIVAQRCSHTARDERLIAAPSVPLRTVHSRTVAQSALMIPLRGQRFIVGVLTMKRSILQPLQPSDFIVHTVHAQVSAILASGTGCYLSDRSARHTKHGVVSAIFGSIARARTAPVVGSVGGQLHISVFITGDIVTVPSEETAGNSLIRIYLDCSKPRRYRFALHLDKARQWIFRVGTNPLCTLNLQPEIILRLLQHHITVRAVNHSGSTAVFLTAVIRMQVVFYRSVWILNEAFQFRLNRKRLVQVQITNPFELVITACKISLYSVPHIIRILRFRITAT